MFIKLTRLQTNKVTNKLRYKNPPDADFFVPFKRVKDLVKK